MKSIRAYVGFLAVFLVIDGLWIHFFGLPMYYNEVGQLLSPEPKLAAATVFYLCYAAAAVFLAVRPSQTLFQAALNGAVLGGLAYGTFAVTNYAMIDGWPLKLLISDIVLGVVLTTSGATTAYYFGKPNKKSITNA